VGGRFFPPAKVGSEQQKQVKTRNCTKYYPINVNYYISC
jgi:hypothetical protein